MFSYPYYDTVPLKIEEELRRAAVRADDLTKLEAGRTRPHRRVRWQLARRKYTLTAARRSETAA